VAVGVALAKRVQEIAELGVGQAIAGLRQASAAGRERLATAGERLAIGATRAMIIAICGLTVKPSRAQATAGATTSRKRQAAGAPMQFEQADQFPGNRCRPCRCGRPAWSAPKSTVTGAKSRAVGKPVEAAPRHRRKKIEDFVAVRGVTPEAGTAAAERGQRQFGSAPASPPAPTGYLHIGGARTALFSWAFARRHGGSFILRIEDTDVARSTPAAVQAILDGMHWLGLEHDEGPFYQMQRMDRYKEVIGQMLAAGTAYHCYMSPEELDRCARSSARGREAALRRALAPRAGQDPAAAARPACSRWCASQPGDGVVAWDDLVKGRIEIANAEMDDLIIARADGTPTYNFCVVVDDWDMGITHVIRGDDHVNNTPRQINILQALGAEVPLYAHLSMILGDDGTEAVQAPRRGERDAVRRRRLPARGGHQLPGAPGLEPRRRRDLQPRAVRRVVRPRPHHAVGGAVQHREAQLAQRAVHQGRPTCKRAA
jgi:hypothetical protein